MLANERWFEPKVAVDPFSLESLIAWLETKDPHETYYWSDCGHCLMGQYLREVTDTKNPEVDFIYSEVLGFGWPYVQVAASLPHTFGAALSRARAELAKRQ